MDHERVAAIAGRLSLRPPQRQALVILDHLTALFPLRRTLGHVGSDLRDVLASVNAHYPTVGDFERDFPSLCFALATGVGKTRLMGAFIAYLHDVHRIRNFLVLAPNLTIYDKLIADFTPGSPKYVLKGIGDFALSPPTVTTGENYEQQIAGGGRLFPVAINIFNIAKLNAEVRGGRAPRIRSFREELGESYFDHLSGLDDLVLIMDESHRYRGTAGLRVLNELKPVLGLELTATPFIESSRGRQPFRNVVYEYPLARAMEAGFVKEPAVVTRENFSAVGMSAEALERLKLDDAIRLHENTKAELQSYAQQTGQAVVKPFVLVIARDTTHAASLMRLLTSVAFFEGRYAGKVIQVDSSAREEETIARLLKVESADEPTEIVIHVNMLKEGWDVSNLYTIVPLRAASAHTLVHQTVGRGLRLPYGQRTGVPAVDRLNIVAHDRFQEMIEEARKPGSPLRLREVVVGEDSFAQRPIVVECAPNLLARLGLRPDHQSAGPAAFGAEQLPAAAATWQLICERETGSDRIGSIEHLRSADVLSALSTEVARRCRASVGTARPDPTPELTKTVAKVAELVLEQTIAIPRIVVRPSRQTGVAFQWFQLDVSRLPRSEPDEVLWASHLRTGKIDRLSTVSAAVEEKSPEDQLVSRLGDFNDVAYDACAELLHDLAGQVLRHLRGLMGEEEVRRLLRLRGEEIATLVHAQMQEHVLWQQEICQEVTITRGFTALRCSAFAAIAGEVPVDFRLPVSDKGKISRHLFSGFHRCLYPIQKFDSEAERRMALVLDREADKWLRPARGQFHMFYRLGAEEAEYVPDFVAEIKDRILLIETKAATSMHDADVRAKRDIAVTWCAHASDYARMHGGKPWTYLLVPHDAVLENTTIAGLVGAWRESIAPAALLPALA